MRPRAKLPWGKQVLFAVGQLGWSTLVNVVNLQLVYFFLPPEGAGFPLFISQAVFWGVLNALTLLAAAGRLLDGITDPLVAHLSDRWPGKQGRRIPFLKAGALPTAVFCTLMFFPVVSSESGWNILWLFVAQALFYLSLTLYVTPYFALLAELGHNAEERLDLSTWISITYALGVVVASQIPFLSSFLGAFFELEDRVRCLQVAIAVIAGFAALMMMVPVWFIDEKRYSTGQPVSVPLRDSLRRTMANRNFRLYVVADFSYFMGFTIIMTGLLYYITVLLLLPERMLGVLVPVLVVVSFVFYPLVNISAKKWGKKKVLVWSFFFMSAVFFFVFFLGRGPLSAEGQAYAVILFFAVPVSALGILPNAILADIAGRDAERTGVNQEGVFFAARTLMQKFGQTLGVFVFAALTSLGRDPGDDLGVRLSGLVGCGLCLGAGLVFRRYDERQV